jgi:hypothetical protein
LFGSSVKLSHHPTGLAIIASTVEDDGHKDGKLRCVFLSATADIPPDSLVHKWIITPRYKLREEGDPVRHSDYVILRNAQYKHLCLTSFPAKRAVNVPAQETPFADYMVGLCSVPVANTKPGLNLLLLRRAPVNADTEGPATGPAKASAHRTKEAGNKTAAGEAAEDRTAVISTDYVRVVHREYRGHLVVRTDDEVELQSSVMPLGATTRKRGSRNVDNNLTVFLRAFSNQQPREQLDFPAAYSSQGVWQVLSTESASDTAAHHGKLKIDSSVRLRHVITGQYLCVRPLVSEDTDKLKQFCSFCIPGQGASDSVDDPNATPANRDRRREEATPPADTGDKHAPSSLPTSPPVDDAAAGKSRAPTPSIFGPSPTPSLPGRATPSVHPSLHGPSPIPSQHGRSATPSLPPSQHGSGSSPTLSLEASLSPSPPAPINLCVESVRADDLQSTDWTGKHRNSVQLTMTTKSGVWTLRSKRSAAPGNTCLWEFDKLDYEAHLSVMEAELPSCALEVTVFRENPISGRVPIGEGRSLIPHVVVDCDADESMDMTVGLVEPGSAEPAGVVVVRLLVNALLTKEEARILSERKAHPVVPNLMDIVGTIKGAFVGNQNLTLAAPEQAKGAVSPDVGADEENDDDSAEVTDQGLLEGVNGLSAAAIAATNWVVATSTVPDKYTKFNLLIVDKKGTVVAEDDIVSYNERFVFEHAHTRQRMKLSTLLGMESRSTWWEYTGDVPLVPDPFREGSIVDSEVCQFEAVEPSEIRDIMYGCRFLQLARAATTALQLTPRSNQLFMPLFRHFHNSLLSLTLWTLGEVESGATLCAEATAAPEIKKAAKGRGAIRTITKLGLAGDALKHVPGGEQLVSGVQQGVKGAQKGIQHMQQGVHDGLALLGLDANMLVPEDDDDEEEEASGYWEDDDDDDLFGDGPTAGVYDDDDTDSEDDADGDGDGMDDTAALQMNIYSPGSQYKVLGSVGRKHSSRRLKREQAVAAAKAAAAAAEASQVVRVPSLSPWVGRKVPRALCKGKGKAAVPVDTYAPVEDTPLQQYAGSKLDEFVFKDLPVNEVLLRRQIILSDMMFIDQVVHFLNVLFQLQRAASLTHDEDMRNQIREVPPMLLACSVQINKLIRACVFKNDKVALKLISVQGSFLAMISQKIQGWEPPIDAILLQTCKEDGSESAMYGCVGSINSQNDSLLDSSMSILSSAKGQDVDGDDDDVVAEKETAGPASFNIEPILMDAISANDVRQVVEQMHELHLKRDPSALKILGLLTLLCSSGRAKKYFQNLLINALAIQDHDDYSLSGDFVHCVRDGSLQTNCMLFFTQFANDQWQVKFSNPFSFPSQQGKNQEQLRHKLDKEGSSLQKLFAYYNTDDNAVLDVMESFELLEDLGLGGPFLYKEVGPAYSRGVCNKCNSTIMCSNGCRSATWRAPRYGASRRGGATEAASTIRPHLFRSASCRPFRPSK